MWRSILRHGPGCPSNEANGSDRCLRRCSRATIAARGLVGSRFSLCCQPGVGQAAAAWLQCAVLAHNLIRWTTIAGGVRVDNQLIVAAPSAPDWSPSPAESSTAPAGRPCGSQSTGPGRKRSPPRSTPCAPCDPPPPEPAIAVRRAASHHQR